MEIKLVERIESWGTSKTEFKSHCSVLCFVRFNIKQKLSGEPSITEQEFDDLVIRKSQSGREEDGTGRSKNAEVTHDDDLASLSGSESEADEDESDRSGH